MKKLIALLMIAGVLCVTLGCGTDTKMTTKTGPSGSSTEKTSGK